MFILHAGEFFILPRENQDVLDSYRVGAKRDMLLSMAIEAFRFIRITVASYRLPVEGRSLMDFSQTCATGTKITSALRSLYMRHCRTWTMQAGLPISSEWYPYKNCGKILRVLRRIGTPSLYCCGSPSITSSMSRRYLGSKRCKPNSHPNRTSQEVTS